MMFRELPHYPAYHHPIDWLDEVPAHWARRRFGTLLRERDARSVTGEEQLLRVSQYTGVTERRTESGEGIDSRSESLVGYKKVVKGQLAVNIMLAWNGSLGVSRYYGIVSPAYCVYSFKPHADPWYFHHLLRSPQFKARIRASSRGIVDSRLRLYSEDLYRLEAAVPPMKEQAAIVKYLAHANSRIDKAVTAKRHLISLLDEQANAQRASLLQGLGQEQRLANIVWEGPTNGVSPEISESGDLQTVSISVVRAGVVDVRESDIKYVERTAVRDVGKYALRAGDILIVRGNGNLKLVGRAARVPVDMPDRIYPDLLMRIRFRTGIDSRFVVAVLNSPAVREQIETTCRTAVGTYKLSGADVRGLRVPVPELGVQHRIVQELEAIDANFARVAVKLSREIDLLQEFRTRLIADVVTGQVDVRAIAAALPDSPEPFDKVSTTIDEELEEAPSGSED